MNYELLLLLLLLPIVVQIAIFLWSLWIWPDLLMVSQMKLVGNAWLVYFFLYKMT